ncbi:MAG: FAD-dependent oxidoreductase [Deltaproteobacteria bacterium]|nr:FAD-dependent oxidoreductase [Deltaproteobacteria bacterium]
MEAYWDCSLCRVEDKANAFRCRTCFGKLKGRDRLQREVADRWHTRPVAAVLSAVAAGLGQVYARRWATGLVLATLIPLAIGLVTSVWQGFTYGHVFLAGAALFVLGVAVADARLGPSVRVAPCQQTCPAGVDIPDYLQLLLDGAYEQGHALVRTKIPLVGVIGRICPHPCEIRCIRGIDGEPISINGSKRFLADRHREVVRRQAGERRSGSVVVNGGRRSVGVVGSGPAGIACAYYLSVLGASVTVYEADSVLGGRLGTTIPDYRLPPFILEEELEELRDRGVVFSPDTPVGPGGVGIAELLAEHGGVFLAVGAQESLELKVSGVGGGRDFQDVLRRAKLGLPIELGRRVAVIGGGNAAMDVCRTALRLGATEVHVCYRRTRDEMPARADEVEEALREGVQIHFLTDPVELSGEGGGGGRLVLRKMRLGEPDASGRPRPEPVPGSDWALEVDAVVPALGQRVSGSVFEDAALSGLRREPDGRVWVDPTTQRTSLERVYAGGDAASGPATAVAAMAQGRRAALALWRELVPGRQGPGLRLVDRRIRKPFPGHRETPEAKIREEMPRLSLRARTGNCREVEEGFREAAACREAGRCLQCHREL